MKAVLADLHRHGFDLVIQPPPFVDKHHQGGVGLATTGEEGVDLPSIGQGLGYGVAALGLGVHQSTIGENHRQGYSDKSFGK